MSTSLSALNAAAAGIQTSYRGLEQTAHRIASQATGDVIPAELADALVTALLHRYALEASASVARRADEALAAVLDAID